MIVKPNQKIQVVASNDGPSEVIVSGVIGDYGLQGKDLRNALDGIPKGKKINLRVNSEGGSVADGLEMYHAIATRASDVTSYIHGYALSAASVFPLAAGEVISPKGSIWMIHCAACFSYGNEADKIKDAEMLKVHDDEMANIYSQKTGKSKKDILDAMQAETWMTSDEAVEFGLADENPEAGEDPILGVLDNKKFKHVPEPLLLAITMQGRKPAANAGGNDKESMITKKQIALLKKHGIVASEDWTEEQFMTALEKIEATQPATPAAPAQPATPAAPAQPAASTNNIVTAEEMRQIRAALDAERLSRVRALVIQHGANRISNANLDRWVTRALADETGTLTEIDAMPENLPGAHQIGSSVSITAECPRDRLLREHPGNTITSRLARHTEMRSNWNEMWPDAQARDVRAGSFTRGDVQAANSYSGSLVTQFLLDGAVTQLQNRWAALAVFQRDFSTDRYKPLATAQMKYVSGTDGQVQTNAASFEVGDSTVGNIQVAVNHYSRSFHVTDSELNSGLRMENLLEINMAAFADAIIQIATTPITAANFNTLAPIIRAPGNFAWGDMQQAWGQIKKSPIHNALLDGEYLAQIINVPTQFQKSGVGPGKAWAEFGWDNIALNTNWTKADPNTRGFVCNPQAIAAVAGLPLTPPNIPGATLQEGTILIPGPDITVAFYMWFSLASRTLWYSYDLMFGASAMDTTAGLIIRSA